MTYYTHKFTWYASSSAQLTPPKHLGYSMSY